MGLSLGSPKHAFMLLALLMCIVKLVLYLWLVLMLILIKPMWAQAWRQAPDRQTAAISRPKAAQEAQEEGCSCIVGPLCVLLCTSAVWYA